MSNLTGLWAVLALVSTSGGALAQKTENGPPVVAQQDRAVPNGRAVQITLAQSRIGTTVEVGRVAQSPFGGSLFGGLVMDRIRDDNRDTMLDSLSQKAEALAAPLRQTLQDFDVEALAVTATRAAVTRPDWLQAKDVTATRDPAQGYAALLASSDASQFVLIRYRYELSPDFSQIRVIAEITLRKRPGAKDTSVVPGLIYRQNILSAVQLRKRSYEPGDNVALWSAENGKLAKAALAAAFGRFEQLLPHALGLGQKDIDSLSDKRHEKAFAGGFYGSLIARNPSDPDDVLIWAKGLVQVQSVP